MALTFDVDAGLRKRPHMKIPHLSLRISAIGSAITLLASVLAIAMPSIDTAHAAPAWVPGSYWSGTGSPNAVLGSSTLAYGNNKIVAAGGDNNSTYTLASTPDAYTWTPRKAAKLTITAYAIVNNVETVTTTETHGFAVGEVIYIGDVNGLMTGLGMINSQTGFPMSYCAQCSPSSPAIPFTISAVTTNTFSYNLNDPTVLDVSVSGITGLVYNDTANATFKGVAFGGSSGNERFIAVRPGTTKRMFVSLDGDTWSAPLSSADVFEARPNAITFGNGKFVAVGSSCSMISSADNGATWTNKVAISGCSTNGWNSVTYGNGKFVAVANSGTKRIAYSSDGINWTTVTAPEDGNTWNRVSYGGGQFVAIASSGTNRIMTSTDGVTWIAKSVPNYLTTAWESVQYTGSSWVLAGPSGLIAYSSDDTATWTIPPTYHRFLQNAALSSMVMVGSSLYGLARDPQGGTFVSTQPSAPTVSSSPGSGLPSGGASLTISGNNLRGVISVTIGSSPATITNATGNQTLTTAPGGTVVVTTPAGTLGSQPVEIETLGGTVSTTYTYAYPAPTISNASGTGTSSGGTSVTITGTNLTTATAVTLGTSSSDATLNSTPVTSFVVASATSITAVMPPRPCAQSATAIWYIRVTTLGGTTAGNTNYKFTYSSASAPTVTSLSTSTGGAGGGTLTTITGTNFQCVSAVKFGGSAGTNATSFTVNSSTSITAIAPARAVGVVGVYVVAEGGNSTLANAFTYVPSPVVSSVSPVSGPAIGGTSITITGTDFVSGATISVGGAACASVAFVSSTSLTCTTPTQSAGPKDIVVTNPDTQSGTGAGLFTFVPAPTVTAITPSSGDVAGLQNVSITGSGFRAGASVSIGGSAACTGVTVVSASSITCTTSASSAVTGVAVRVTNTDMQYGELVNGYSYTTTTTTISPAPSSNSNVSISATTTTTVPRTPVTNPNVSVSSGPVPTLITPANQAALEASPGSAVAVINGKSISVEQIKVEQNATPAAMQEAAKEIVAEISKLLPAGAKNDIKAVITADGAELTGLMVNPDDPAEKLNVPVESVTLVKAGDAAVLISALNQTNLPAEVAPGGVIQVTRGGIVAARAYGLPGSQKGEIVLMSTPRLLQTFTVSANGSYDGQVPLPKDISFGSHTVVMATANAKVSLGIKLVRTRMQFRIKRTIGTAIFKNRAGVRKDGGKVSITGSGRCKANLSQVKMAAKPGGCYITVKQAAKGKNPAVFTRFTVSVVKKLKKVKK